MVLFFNDVQNNRNRNITIPHNENNYYTDVIKDVQNVIELFLRKINLFHKGVVC